MSVQNRFTRRAAFAISAVGITALVLSGCASDGGGDGDGGDGGGGGGGDVIVGTTDKVTTLDPAGSYDNGSLQVQSNVFPYLVNTDYNSTDVVPDLAETARVHLPHRIHGDPS